MKNKLVSLGWLFMLIGFFTTAIAGYSEHKWIYAISIPCLAAALVVFVIYIRRFGKKHK